MWSLLPRRRSQNNGSPMPRIVSKRIPDTRWRPFAVTSRWLTSPSQYPMPMKISNYNQEWNSRCWKIGPALGLNFFASVPVDLYQ